MKIGFPRKSDMKHSATIQCYNILKIFNNKNALDYDVHTHAYTQLVMGQDVMHERQR